LIQIFSGERLTEKEIREMNQSLKIPDIVHRIDDKAIRDFIINGCIKQTKVTKASDLKKYSFLSTFSSLSSYILGSKKDERYCRDLIKAEKLNVEEIKLTMDQEVI